MSNIQPPQRRGLWRAAATLATVVWLGACAGGATDASLSLDAKLARQQARFEAVQQRLVERHADVSVPLAQRTIARSEWEQWLAPAAHEQFTPEDLAQLQARYDAQVASSRAQAVQRSRIDLAALRALPTEQATPYMRELCTAIPKGGMLHIHPWGSLTPATYRTLLEQRNPIIDAATLAQTLSDTQGRAWLYPDELAWLRSLPAQAPYLSWPQADRERLVALAVLPEGVQPFERFEAMFRLMALAIGGDWRNLEQSYNEFAQRAVQAGVSYVEFTERIPPEEVPQYEAIAQRLEARWGLTVRFNNAYFRTAPAAEQDAQVQAMLRAGPSPYIPGIDLLANEGDTPALEHGQTVYGPVLADVRRQNRPWRRTLHAGELGARHNPRDALLLGAERLGHGVRLMDDPLTLHYAITQAVPIEINLTSNLKLGAVSDIRQHPFLTYLRLGLPVSLSTDDEGMFATDIVKECLLAVAQTDVTYHELKEMARNSIRTSFASDDVKARLLSELAQRFVQWEASAWWGSLPPVLVAKPQ